MQNPIYDTITSNHLNYHQKLNALCVEAENTLNVLELPEHFQKFYERGALCDMNEGHAPYRLSLIHI